MAASPVHPDVSADGGHVCCFFDDDEQQRAILDRFVSDGVASGHRVVCICDAASTRQIIDDLAHAPEHREAVRRGQLVVARSDQAYVADGYFDPDRMLDWWPGALARAQEDGYPGLRVTGDVTWYGRALPGTERLMEYERAVGAVLGGTAASALCQYDRRRLADEVLEEAIAHHGGATGSGSPVPPQAFRVLGAAPDGLRLVGELDIVGLGVLADVLSAAVADGVERLRLDLAELRFIDAAGASALCRPAARHHVPTELRDPQPLVRRVLSVLGADRLPAIRLEPDAGR